MQPDHFRFGGGSAGTVLHPLVLATMLVVILLIFLLSRKNIHLPFLLSTFLIPEGQQMVVGGVHLFVLRIIILAGLARMAFSRLTTQDKLLAGGWNSIDKAFLLWASLHVLAFTLLFQEMGAVVNQVGYLWDGLGAYLLLRFMIRDEEDIKKAIKCFAFLTIVLALCMVQEQFTGRDVFGFLGGVNVLSEVREGRIRSQAVFQHSLLAGAFGATTLPLMVALWQKGKARLLAIVSAVGATLMVATAASSTPIISWIAGIAAIFFWPLRRRMRTVRWGVVVLLLSLILVMQAPVWFLIARVSMAGGSSSYHRAMLVDNFVRHFPEWWLLGTDANSKWGSDMWDTSNRYVEEGVTGGLAAFLCFLGVIYWSFSRIGRARRAVEKDDPYKERLLWLLGAAMFAHVVAFWGISYFDQTEVAWSALLAMISAITAPYLESAPKLQEKLTDSNLSVSNSRPGYQMALLASTASRLKNQRYQELNGRHNRLSRPALGSVFPRQSIDKTKSRDVNGNPH